MFKVHWAKTAREELAKLWTQASSERRQLITLATALIDDRLRRHPEVQGESRDTPNVRILFEPPLAIEVHLDLDNHRVKVVRVWDY